MTGSGRLVATLTTHPRLCVLQSRRQRILYVSKPNGVLQVDDLESGERFQYPGLAAIDIDSIAAIPGTDRFLVVSFERRTISVYDIDTPGPARQIIPLNETTDLAYARATADGRVLLLRDFSGAEVWDLNDGARLKRYKASESLTAAVLSRDGQSLIVGDGRVVKALDLVSDCEAAFYSDAPVAAVASLQGAVVLAGSVDGAIHQLELRKASRV
jgi:hypothetical protein